MTPLHRTLLSDDEAKEGQRNQGESDDRGEARGAPSRGDETVVGNGAVEIHRSAGKGVVRQSVDPGFGSAPPRNRPTRKIRRAEASSIPMLRVLPDTGHDTAYRAFAFRPGGMVRRTGPEVVSGKASLSFVFPICLSQSLAINRSNPGFWFLT